jgi:hypothetical protein
MLNKWVFNRYRMLPEMNPVGRWAKVYLYMIAALITMRGL